MCCHLQPLTGGLRVVTGQAKGVSLVPGDQGYVECILEYEYVWLWPQQGVMSLAITCAERKLATNVHDYMPYLVEHIIKNVMEIFKINEDHCSTNLHADLDLVDVPTHLHADGNEREKQ